MKIEIKFEFLTNIIDKHVFVFKIEQIDRDNKKSDIRKKSLDISRILFDLIVINKLDMFYYTQEIQTSQRFKIFIYLFCSEPLKNEIYFKYLRPNRITGVII